MTRAVRRERQCEPKVALHAPVCLAALQPSQRQVMQEVLTSARPRVASSQRLDEHLVLLATAHPELLPQNSLSCLLLYLPGFSPRALPAAAHAFS